MDLEIKGYTLEQELGKGGFATVYRAYDHKHNRNVAIKVEQGKYATLAKESYYLSNLDGLTGFPAYYELRRIGVQRVLIMELLGESLTDFVIRKGSRPLPMQMILQAFKQMISRLNALHSRGIVHCDIKPCNMMLGLGEKQKRLVYLVDFGLSNEFSESDLPAQEKNRASIEGTPEFASANAHRGLIQTRRDDLEMLVYSLIFLSTGKLPWIPFEGQESVNMKLRLNPFQICQNLPDVFHTILVYVKSLSFAAKPDYSYLKDLLRRVTGAKRTIRSSVSVAPKILAMQLRGLHSPGPNRFQNGAIAVKRNAKTPKPYVKHDESFTGLKQAVQSIEVESEQDDSSRPALLQTRQELSSPDLEFVSAFGSFEDPISRGKILPLDHTSPMNSSVYQLSHGSSAELSLDWQSNFTIGRSRFAPTLELVKLKNLPHSTQNRLHSFDIEFEAKYGQSPLVKVDEEENSESCANEVSESGAETDRLPQDRLACSLDTKLLREMRDRANLSATKV